MFNEKYACNLLIFLIYTIECGYICNQPRGGSSHYTYRKKGKYPLTIPKKEPYVKETYVRLVIEALEEE